MEDGWVRSSGWDGGGLGLGKGGWAQTATADGKGVLGLGCPLLGNRLGRVYLLKANPGRPWSLGWQILVDTVHPVGKPGDPGYSPGPGPWMRWR